MHPPLDSLNALPHDSPHNSGAIQWAKALRRRAPRGSRMEANKPAHLLLLYDDCLVTQHPQV